MKSPRPKKKLPVKLTKREPLEVKEIVAIDDLTPHPRNYRTHPDDQIDQLIQSIKEFGLYRSVIIAKDGTILAGHGLVIAVKKMGIKKISVIRLNLKPDNAQALKILIGDNELEHLGVVDDRALSDMLKEIKEVTDSLLGTGYDEMMLANLVFVTRTRDEVVDFDKASHWAGMPDHDMGKEVYQLIINFASEKARDLFFKKIGIKKEATTTSSTGKLCTCWWPIRERVDLSSVKMIETKSH